MPKDSGKSNRRFERIATPKGLWVAWQHNTNQNVSRVRDLNVGGLFIATPTPTPQGVTLTVLLSVPEGEIRSQALVRNVTPGEGMGIEFKDISAQDADRLQRLIARLLRSGPNDSA
ncbi:MAG TPA: PilZ domain-containing protein [Candidatus Bathyarchaeia archaeon]|nr:PilZ domain-containing protein [Candidatus Bathyarchaeia archaeon]